jgi:integrase
MIRDAAHAKRRRGCAAWTPTRFATSSLPKRSRGKLAKQLLYPSEFLALTSCAAVPLRWKVNFAIAVYLGLRDGEQRALRWAHVDLEHAAVNVCETTTKGEAREGTKSDATRTVPIPAPLLPLLRDMHKAAGGGGLVCRGIASQRAMAPGLRTWLRKAGVTRASLFTSTSVNLNIRWHDLRATCGTWLAVAGRSAMEIRDVLGHTQVTMTDRYLRDASAVRDGTFGEVFPALPFNCHPIAILPVAIADRAKKEAL